MANDISGPVWRIDTAPFTYKYPVKITNLNITDATAADHVVITQANGKPLVDFTANASELDYRIGGLLWVQGISIGSGGLGTTAVVYIAVGAGK
jgi:hypothetical protein